jgi:lipopolysaccharide export system protein LptA
MMRFATIIMTATICAGFTALAPKAFAQTRVMLRGAAFDQPKIWADRLEVSDRTKTATFSGNVQLVQGDATIRCRSLIVSYVREVGGIGGATAVNSLLGTPREPPRHISRVEMLGAVTITTKDQSASGDIGIYDRSTKAITLIGDVVIAPKASEQ